MRNCGPVWRPLTPVRKAAPFPRTVSAASTKPWAPRALRHALGEYYTPGWLAERTLQNAVSASGQQAGDLRFLDPACGSGVFLIQALRMIRADTPQGPPLSDQVAGFDLHPLAVLTAKVNYLAVMARQPLPEAGLFLPIYRYDALNIPILRGDTLVIDTGCGLACDVPLSLCRQVVEMRPDRRNFFPCRRRGLLTPHRPRTGGFFWPVSAESYLGVLRSKGRYSHGKSPTVELEVPVPPVSGRVPAFVGGIRPVAGKRPPARVFPRRMCPPCSPAPRWTAFSSPVGASVLSCAQATFRPPRYGAGFRRFHLDGPGLDFGCWRWKTLAASGPSTGSVPLLRWYSSSGRPPRFPCPLPDRQAKPGFRRAVRSPDATIASVLPFARMENMTAAPAHRD